MTLWNLKAIDLLSHPPNLKINSCNSYKTAIGGFISLVILTLSLLCIIYFSSDLFFKVDPTTIESIVNYDDFSFNLGQNGFNLFLTLENSKLFYHRNKRIYSVNATMTYFNIDSEGMLSISNQHVEIDDCDKYYNSSTLSKESLLDISPLLFYCFNPNQHLFISNFWGAPSHSAIYIDVRKCQNTTSFNDCLPEAEIDNEIRGGILTINSKNSIMNVNNLMQPLEPIIDDIFF